MTTTSGVPSRRAPVPIRAMTSGGECCSPAPAARRRPADVDVDHAIHLVERGLLEGFRNGRAGIVYRHIPSDLGLARGGAPNRRFEVVGADIGRAFALTHDMGERRAEVVWDSIALHTTPSIAQHKGADVACCQNGIACDYGGLGYQELSDDNKKVILSAYPRLDMKNMLTTCLCGIAKNHPNTTRDNFIADFGIKYIPGYTRVSSVDFLRQAPFAE